MSASASAAPQLSVTVVPSISDVNQDWNITCTHTSSQLDARIPLRFIHALQTGEEVAPIFQPHNFRTTRPCFQGTRCFRAVRDNFINQDEAEEMLRGLKSVYDRPKGQKVGEHFVSIHAKLFPAGFLDNITSRMKTFLEDEMGAVGVRVSHTNSRGEWAFQNNLTAGIAEAGERQEQLLSGAFSRRRGHIDAARPVYWHYTCLLYVGEHGASQFAGGETLLIDEVERRHGNVRSGLLVEPRRGRLLAFSSGAENVHTALEATYGFRSLIQVWFSCEPKKPALVVDAEGLPMRSEDANARLEL